MDRIVAPMFDVLDALPFPDHVPEVADQILERRWFSDMKQVEVDQCPKCNGIRLDAGEFTRVQEELGGPKVTAPGWAVAIQQAVICITVRYPESAQSAE